MFLTENTEYKEADDVHQSTEEQSGVCEPVYKLRFHFQRVYKICKEKGRQCR